MNRLYLVGRLAYPCRDSKGERRPASDFAAHHNLPPKCFCHPLADCESKTGPGSVTRIETTELLEDLFVFVRGYAETGISNFDVDRKTSFSNDHRRILSDMDCHRTGLSVLDRIG